MSRKQSEMTADDANDQSIGKSQQIIVGNPQGLHARPAAMLANLAKRFSSKIDITKAGKTINAKSVVAIMNLEIRRHDVITLSAMGEDAAEALASLTLLLESDQEEASEITPEQPAMQADVRSSQIFRPASGYLHGIPVSPGKVAGRSFQLRPAQPRKQAEKGRSQEIENEKLRIAIESAGKELEGLSKNRNGSAETTIFIAHREMLNDPELLGKAHRSIADGYSAAYAWHHAYTALADMLQRHKDAFFAARADDIKDVGKRVLRHLATEPGQTETVPEGSVVIVSETTPSDILRIATSGAIGLCAAQGSATSHASILARTFGIPAIAAIDEQALELPDGTPVILDGSSGTLQVNPAAEEMEAFRNKPAKAEYERPANPHETNAPTVTSDGHRIKVLANIGGISEAEQVVRSGGEGVGLLRTEFLFLQKTQAPGEEEQAASYIAIAKALGSQRDFVVRTLDVGGDKPLPYLPIRPEDNPQLGMRGIRINMLDTGLFETQIRALLAAAEYASLRIMFPMITSLSELQNAKKVVLQEKERMGIHTGVKIGIMVEVPAAALMADEFAKEVDFFSIGTNDLTQYTLAVDRGHPRLAAMADALHPAVLRLIAKTAEDAGIHGKGVGVCGEIAGDMQALPMLIGLGIDELSVNVAMIPSVKDTIHKLSHKQCQQIARRALTMTSAKEVRAYLAQFAFAR